MFNLFYKATEKLLAEDLGRKERFQTISLMGTYSLKSIEVCDFYLLPTSSW